MWALHNGPSHTGRHLLTRSSLHVNMTACTPSLHSQRELWLSRHELPSCCHQMLRDDALAPERINISNRCVCPSGCPRSLRASCVRWRDTHKVPPTLQLSCVDPTARSSNRLCVWTSAQVSRSVSKRILRVVFFFLGIYTLLAARPV